MLYVQIAKGSGIIEKIRNFYLLLYKQRLYSNARFKYTRVQAERNIRNALSFIGQKYNDSVLKKTTMPQWSKNGWYEIRHKSWHLAVTVQLDLFGNNIAIVQDCCHDKDYHNDTMETEPFKMDNPDDKSHLVDWKELKLKTIIIETINQYLKENLV